MKHYCRTLTHYMINLLGLFKNIHSFKATRILAINGPIIIIFNGDILNEVET